MLGEQFMFDRSLDSARKNLTPDSFKDAWAEGSRMTRDQAVQHARTIIAATTG
jgi:dihydropteroate synthase